MTLRDRIAHQFRLRKPEALRVSYWLRRLFEEDKVHSECGLVPYRPTSHPVHSLVCTVDWENPAVGCAWCGEWAADMGQRLADGFKLVGLVDTSLPHDVRKLDLAPAVLYCGDCFTKHREHFGHVFDLD